MQKSKRYAWLWINLALSSLILFGCSSNSSSPGATTDAVFPFGLDSSVITTDTDGDGNWDKKETTTYEFDSRGRLILQSILTEKDNDGNGITDYKYVNTYGFDPDVNASDINIFKAMESGPSSLIGTAIILKRYEEYNIGTAEDPQLSYLREYTYCFDDDGNLASNSYSRRNFDLLDGTPYNLSDWSYTYEYDSAGNLINESYTDSDDDDGDGTLDYFYTDEDTYTYNAAGNRTSRTYVESEDDNGDGVIDYIDTEEYSYIYDASGNLLSEIEIDSYDNDADGELDESYTYSLTYVYDPNGNPTSETFSYSEDTNADGTPDYTDKYSTEYDNTYDGGNLVQVVASGDDNYTVNYDYDAAGNLIERTYPSDNYPSDAIDGVDDTFESEFWSYDSAGRLTSRIDTYKYNTDNDVFWDYQYAYIYTYEYDTDGLLTLYSNEYQYDSSSDDDGILNSRYSYVYTYSYENGKMTGYSSLYRSDNDSDGDLDDQYSDTDTYSYNNGNLASYTSTYASNPGTGVLEDQNQEGMTFNYNESGLLTGTTEWQDSDNDGEYDSSTTTTINFDELGRVSGVSETGAEYSMTTTFTYDDEAHSVTFNSSDSNAETEDGILNFGSDPILTGTADVPIMSRGVNYPNIYEMDAKIKISFEGESDAYRRYEMTIPLPRILVLIYGYNEKPK